jgi:ABC-2 type transport system permease protein
MLPYLLISLVAAVLIVVSAAALFGVFVRGPYAALLLATFVYLLGALGFGLLVSTMAESQAMAFQVGMVTSMLPAIFLSGFIFPIASMPLPLQILTHAVPARYFNVILRGVILKGSGLLPYWRDLAFLLLYALAVNAIAYGRLTKREA